MTAPALTAPLLPAPLGPLSFLEFAELVERVASRTQDPTAQAALDADADLAPVMAQYVAAVDRYADQFNRGVLQLTRPDEVSRTPALRIRLHDVKQYPHFGASTRGLLSRELAVALGELMRFSRMDAASMDTAPAGRSVTPAAVVARLGDERRVATLFPVFRACADAIFRQKRQPLAEGQPGFPASYVTMLVDRLAALQETLSPDGDHRITKLNIGSSFLPAVAQAMATAPVLQPTELPALFQHAYENRWHTAPRTKNPTGALVYEVRNRALAHGSPELLVVLAASSDGNNRAVAGFSERTPSTVYDKMIYDNSLAVLSGVVQNRQFNNHKAFAMLDTNLAPQTIAVMKLGKVDMNIRVMACERAIAHQGVDPVHVYEYLRDHVTDEDVPQSLWRDFILEMHRRLTLARVHGTPEVIDAFENRVTRFTTLFMDEVLTPYWSARKFVLEQEARGVAPSRWAMKQLAEHKHFIGAHAFVADGALMNILVQGARKPATLQQLLQHYAESKVPLTPELTVAIFTNPDPAVREQGMLLLPHVSEEEVARLQAEIAARVTADKESVRTEVFTNIIPEYEPIEGVERKLSRMHHHFDAANIIPQDDLIRTFVQCAERDPRTIPDEFARLTARARSQARIHAQLETATDAERTAVPATSLVPAAPSGTMVHDDTFGATPRTPGMVSTTPAPTPVAAPKR